MSIILRTDSYKLTHHVQTPPDISNIFSYFESRGGKFKETTFFGLQIPLTELSGVVVTKGDIEFARIKAHQHGVIFNEEGWNHIFNVHKGTLPIIIYAVPEGLTIPGSNVLFTIENTDPKCAWLVSHLESYLVQNWFPTSVTTLSREVKKIIKKYMEISCDNLDNLRFKLHDFGFRGTSSVESAGIGGAAHLVNFSGTDTLEGIMYAERYYKSYKDGMCGFSVPASEHSTMTSWGRENEIKAYENMLEKFPKGIVSIVADSYNIFDACRYIFGEKLKEKILAREGTTVIRFDSGDPTGTLVTGIDILMHKFGFNVNSKGYKVLPDKVRVLQGDGVTYEKIEEIQHSLNVNKFSADNIAAYGMGGGLLQKVDRDTLKFALKCSAIKKNGEWFDVYKDPVGDKSKASKKGRLALIKEEGQYKTIRQEELKGRENILIPVFENGRLLKEHSFKEVRDRAEL